MKRKNLIFIAIFSMACINLQAQNVDIKKQDQSPTSSYLIPAPPAPPEPPTPPAPTVPSAIPFPPEPPAPPAPVEPAEIPLPPDAPLPPDPPKPPAKNKSNLKLGRSVPITSIN